MIEKTDEYLLCEVQNEATLGNRKSVNVPGVRINLPVSYTHLYPHVIPVKLHTMPMTQSY